MRKGQIRQSELNKRRKRREATNRLRMKYLNANSEEERKTVLEKLKLVNPFITLEQFLQPIRNQLNKKEKKE